MRQLYHRIVNYFRKTDGKLLLFLILMLNVKMPVKIFAVIFFLLLNRKMFLEKNIYRQRFVWFYFSIIAIAAINLLLDILAISANHFFASIVGISFWLMCIAAALIISWFVAKTDTDTLHNTITVFFILNAAVTIGQLLLIMWDSGSLNPYTYQGMHQKYFISTGDRLTGITFDVSTTNAIINSFGIVYFLYRNKISLVLLTMVSLLLTASNFTNILLVATFLYLFIFQSNRKQKGVILVCFSMLAVFMIKISPQNKRYAINLFGIKKENSNATNNPGFVFASVKPSIPESSVHSEFNQRKRDTTAYQKELIAFANENIPLFYTNMEYIKDTKLPGKLIAFQQTIHFFKTHPEKIFTGDGIGNFSSKLAFRSSGLGIAGYYPKKIIYVNDDFLNNHLNLYLDYFTRDKELHSLFNNPASVYDQLFSEYGLAGLFVFIFFYATFFLKKIGQLTYGIPLLLLLAGALAVDYWYEQLSIVVLFELLMLINIKEGKKQYE